MAAIAARGMKLAGRVQSLIVGALTGVFVGPTICEFWFSRYDPLESRIPAFICFAVGGTAMSLMPIVVKRLKTLVERYEFKVVSKSDD